MQSAVNSAIALGMKGIVFTDHYDMDPPRGIEGFTYDPAAQQIAIDEIRTAYKDFDILKGIEIGIQKKSLPKISAFLDKFSFDTIIASAHFVEGMDPYFGDYYKNKDWEEAYGFYLQSIYDCISVFDNFDVVGHFDYIVRYSPYKQKMMRYRDFPDHFDSIFKVLKEKGKALEINTNTYRDSYGPAPVLDIEILKRYKESGGEFVSLCSDAHDAGRVGEKFPYYSQIIKDAGFESVVCFKERKPFLMKI
jgi:histidinol-phosphatase (PHP family)